jgi:hypothetical protein
MKTKKQDAHRSMLGAALSILLFCATSLLPAHNCKSAANDFPSPDVLQTGDLIWPKKPGAVVPYNSQPGAAGTRDATRWQQEKDAYLAKLRTKPALSAEEKHRYSALRAMNYPEFVAQYLDNQKPGAETPYSNGATSVGHVGIIQIVDGVPTVVEAMIGFGVRRLTYKQWVEGRPGEFVWLGRLKGVSDAQKAAVAKTAANYIGKPYDFWNFNLSNTTGFYCSKLAWFSILTGAGFAPDDNSNPTRVLWYSPKQLMHSSHIEMIVNPGSYTAPIHQP